MSFLSSLPGLDSNQTGQAQLLKALQVGYPAIAPGNAGGLVYQDLSNTISTVTSTMDDLKIYPRMPKTTATSTVFEYNSLLSYGANPADSIFESEVSVPLDDAANYLKKQLSLKFMGKRGFTSDASRLVNSIVDLETQETMTTSMALLRALEEMLIYGSSALNPLAFDGIETQILANSPATNIFDAHGGTLSFQLVSDLAAVISDAPNYGNPKQFIMNKSVLSAYNRTFLPQGRFDIFQGGTRQLNAQIGGAQDSLVDYEYIGSPFVGTGATGVINPNQNFTQTPVAPTVSAPSAAAAAAGQSSNFLASDAGNYLYWVQASNQYGRSPVVPANTSALNVTAGEVVSFTVTMGGGPSPNYFIIYRSDATGSPSTMGEIGRIANQIGAQGPAAVPFIDSNLKMPGTTSAYFIDFSEEILSWVQLLSMVKIDLAKVRTSKDFMICAIGAFLLRVPTKVGMIRNIAKPTALKP